MEVEDRRVFDRAYRAADVVLTFSGAREAQPLELFLPAGPARRPLLLLLHGGFWRPAYDRSHLRPLAGALANAGWAVALPEYSRVAGAPDDTLADVHAGAAAAATAADSAGAKGDGRIIAIGHSAGGHLALLLAASAGAGIGAVSERLAGALALAPVADLVAAERLNLDDGAVHDWLGGPAAARPDLDPAAPGSPHPLAPVHILHGAADARVPPSVSAALKNADAREVLPGLGHFELIDPEHPIFARLLAELAALANGSAETVSGQPQA